MNIIYEDNHIIALVKPSGTATMGLPEGQETLLTQTKAYIKAKYNKPGEVYLGVVSRLDVPVSGVILFARTSKAAARLNEQFRQHTVEKIYIALVRGIIDPPEADCVDRVINDERHRKVYVTQSADGYESKLHYKTLKHVGTNSLLEIHLETGRKHQIRVQLSSRGYPILGDYKYGYRANQNLSQKATGQNGAGQSVAFDDRIALHAHILRFDHPTTKERIELVAEVPF